MMKLDRFTLDARRLTVVAGLTCSLAFVLAHTSAEEGGPQRSHSRGTSKFPAAFAYIVNQGSRSIAQYRVRADGVLQPLPARPAPTGPDPADPDHAAASPAGRFVYGVVSPDDRNSVAQYRVGPGGALQPLVPPYFAVEYGLTSLAIHPTRPFAYGINYRGYVSLYGVRPNGALSPLRRVAARTGKDPRSLAVDPTGHFVYIVNHLGDTVSQYRVGKDGALAPLSPPTAFAPGQPTCLAVDPTGRFVYVGRVRDERPLAYRIGPGGALKGIVPLNTVHSPQGQGVAEVDVNGPRHALYVVANGGEDTVGHIRQYRLGPDGRPRPLRPPSVEVLVGPSSIGITPDGSSVYVIAGDYLAPYHVRSDGALVPFSLPARGLDRTPVQVMAHKPVAILVVRPPH